MMEHHFLRALFLIRMCRVKTGEAPGGSQDCDISLHYGINIKNERNRRIIYEINYF